MSDELKTILKGALLKELERFFQDRAEEIRIQKIDRNKDFFNQGMESYANEIAAKKVMDIFNELKREIEPSPIIKKSYK